MARWGKGGGDGLFPESRRKLGDRSAAVVLGNNKRIRPLLSPVAEEIRQLAASRGRIGTRRRNFAPRPYRAYSAICLATAAPSTSATARSSW